MRISPSISHSVIIVLLSILVATAVPLPAMQTSARAQEDVPHRIGVRVADGVGEFYDTVTGKRFVPRGANYIDFHSAETGSLQDRVLATNTYDPERVRTAFGALAARGYNTVRIFFDSCMVGPYCITQWDTPGLNPAYMDNLADLIRIAASEGIYLQLTSNDIPDGGGYGDRANRDSDAQIAGYRNAHFLTPGGAETFAQYWRDILTELNARDAPTEAVLGWQLVNEQWFFRLQPPFSLDEGIVSSAAGEYDMSDPAQKQQMAVDNVLNYLNTAVAVIHDLDPGTLVTSGFFAPQYPNPTVTGGDWYVETAPLMGRADLDYFDFHAYPGGDLDVRRVAENFGMLDHPEIPVVMGEYGAFRHLYPGLDGAGIALTNWIADSCALGFDGWLYWEYYGQPTPGDYMWGMVAQDNMLLDRMSPDTMPDPCVAPEVASNNLALGRPVAASAFLSAEPPANITDGSGAQWGAGADAPQWVEIDLEGARGIDRVALTVAQWPAGDTHHRVWAIQSDGSQVLLAEFVQATREGDVLVVALPAPLGGVRAVRVETLSSPSWIAWQEIEVYGDQDAPDIACVLTASGSANLRADPTTAAVIAGSLGAGQRTVADARRWSEDGYVWYHVGGFAWVRSDIVSTSGACDELGSALPADPATPSVTFTVTPPSTTPSGDTLYLAGNFGAYGGPEWEPAGIMMQQQAGGRWTITLDFPPDTILEYKYTRGSWETVEKGKNCEELANRTITVHDSEVIEDTITAWRDVDNCD